MNSFSEAVKVKTCGVLAAAYRGRSLENLKTHAFIEGTEVSLCGRIRADHLADDYSSDKPTCIRCLKKDPRFATKNNSLTNF